MTPVIKIEYLPDNKVKIKDDIDYEGIRPVSVVYCFLTKRPTEADIPVAINNLFPRTASEWEVEGLEDAYYRVELVVVPMWQEVNFPGKTYSLGEKVYYEGILYEVIKDLTNTFPAENNLDYKIINSLTAKGIYKSTQENAYYFTHDFIKFKDTFIKVADNFHGHVEKCNCDPNTSLLKQVLLYGKLLQIQFCIAYGDFKGGQKILEGMENDYN